MDYKNAGVDIEAGYKSVELMKEHVKKNHETRSAWWTGRIFRSIFSGEDQRRWKNRYYCPEQMACGTKIKLAMIIGQARYHWN